MLVFLIEYILFMGVNYLYGDFLDDIIVKIFLNNLYVRYGIDFYFLMIEMLLKG